MHMFTIQQTRKLLYEFAGKYLCLTNIQYLVPDLIPPKNYELVFQDQSEVQSENGNNGIFEGVLCDIFRKDQDFILHVSFVNNDNEIVVERVTNLKLEQVFYEIATYDGEGTWATNCGRLLRLMHMTIQRQEPCLAKRLFELKPCPNRNVVLKKCIQKYRPKPIYCMMPFCNVKIL